MNMQEDNFKEQKLVQVIRTSEEQMRDVQNLVHAIQMMVEMDQYATQHVFDQVRTVIQIAQEAKDKIEIEARETEEILAILDTHQANRTTVDQRDKFMVQLDKLTEGLSV